MSDFSNATLVTNYINIPERQKIKLFWAFIHSFSPPEQNGHGLTFEKSDRLACQSWKPLAYSTNRAWNRQDGQYTTQQIMSVDIHKKEAASSRSCVRENTKSCIIQHFLVMLNDNANVQLMYKVHKNKAWDCGLWSSISRVVHNPHRYQSPGSSHTKRRRPERRHKQTTVLFFCKEIFIYNLW